GDEPLIDFKQLDTLCAAFDDPEVQIATLGIEQVTEDDLKNPNRIKLVCDQSGNALYFSRSPIPNTYHAKEEAKNVFPFMRHIGVYAYRKSTLKELVNLEPSLLEKVESLEQLRWLFYGYSIRVMTTTIETPNIDVPEDVEQVLKSL
ncbi:uncharacterized protein LOC110244399, partial [Exaiptasia diaphana]|uniref:3-deoxy-manno-octulosonate cytidylyltransferase n=1 Tax=Exaiptasia diaphana TaxID=2652724 RepID=A0A913XM12_EXADI